MTNTVTDDFGIKWLTDPETGEILEAAPTEFHIDSPESLAWLLGAERKTRCAQEALKAEAAEVAANYQKLIAAHQRRLDHLAFRYGREAALYAAQNAPNGKTLTTPAGEVRIRSSKSLIVQDEGEAIRWAKEHCPDAVKVVESLLKTPIKAMIEGGGECPVAEVVERTTCTIGSSIKVEMPWGEPCEARR